MNHWLETAEILARVAALRATGGRAAVATVVRISGSAYRRPGARFLIEEAGATLGGVSGGCLEADVRDVAQRVLASGAASLRHYDTGADEDVVWGLGLGCNGFVDVFIQEATGGELGALVDPWRERLDGDSPFAVATLLEPTAGMLVAASSGSVAGTLGDRTLDAAAQPEIHRALASARSVVVEASGRQVFVEVLPPPPHFVICGAGEDARPLVELAAEAGFRVTLIDHRQGLLDAGVGEKARRTILGRAEDVEVELPPPERTFAVVKNHALAHDRAWTRRLLAAGVPYIGLLGPRRRTEAILAEIGAAPEDGARVFGPVGLDLGADGPRQVAVAIVAELLAVAAGRRPRHLRELEAPIHAS